MTQKPLSISARFLCDFIWISTVRPMLAVIAYKAAWARQSAYPCYREVDSSIRFINLV
jgi:hypothetical protein